jgi:hypothetical protein
LKYFNFGENIRKWVNIFYKNIKSCVINNGHCSERFSLGRGGGQTGGPLSPYLFLLAAEILASSITNQNINGIKIDNSEYLISQLADDTTPFLENTEQNYRSCMNLHDKYSEVSGLTINYTKTIAIKIGIKPNPEGFPWPNIAKFKDIFQ